MFNIASDKKDKYSPEKFGATSGIGYESRKPNVSSLGLMLSYPVIGESGYISPFKILYYKLLGSILTRLIFKL